MERQSIEIGGMQRKRSTRQHIVVCHSPNCSFAARSVNFGHNPTTPERLRQVFLADLTAAKVASRKHPDQQIGMTLMELNMARVFGKS